MCKKLANRKERAMDGVSSTRSETGLSFMVQFVEYRELNILLVAFSFENDV